MAKMVSRLRELNLNKYQEYAIINVSKLHIHAKTHTSVSKILVKIQYSFISFSRLTNHIRHYYAVPWRLSKACKDFPTVFCLLIKGILL